MTKPKSFSKYLDTEKKDLEDVLDRNNALNKIPDNPDPSLVGGYKRLALIYRIHDDNVSYNEMLRRIIISANLLMQTRLPKSIEDEKYIKWENDDFIQKATLISRHGEYQFKTGIFFILAHTDLPRAHQIFEWTILNCTLPEDYLSLEHSSHLMNIAYSYLWKGYALLSLERYGE